MGLYFTYVTNKMTHVFLYACIMFDCIESEGIYGCLKDSACIFIILYKRYHERMLFRRLQLNLF